jgi:hypothetical protein
VSRTVWEEARPPILGAGVVAGMSSLLSRRAWLRFCYLTEVPLPDCSTPALETASQPAYHSPDANSMHSLCGQLACPWCFYTRWCPIMAPLCTS